MQNMDLNELSKEELENINGGNTEAYDQLSDYGRLIIAGICPKCMFKSGGSDKGSLKK